MKKWYVNYEEFDNVLDAVDEIMENGDFEDEFDDFLRNEYDDSVEICGVYFDAVEALKELDEMEYEQKFYAWKGGLREDLEGKFERMSVGNLESFYGFDVEVRDADADMFNKAVADLSAIREWVASVPPLYGDTSKTAILEKALNLITFVEAMRERITEEE